MTPLLQNFGSKSEFDSHPKIFIVVLTIDSPEHKKEKQGDHTSCVKNRPKASKILPKMEFNS